MISATFVALLLSSNGDYHSDQYKYSVNPGRFMAFCTDQPPAPIRGFLASTQSVSCSDLVKDKQLPSIIFWAEYNTATQAKSAKILAENECSSAVVRSKRGFANARTFECVSSENDITVVNFFAQSNGNNDLIDVRINYRATIKYSGKRDEEITRLARLISVDIMPRK